MDALIYAKIIQILTATIVSILGFMLALFSYFLDFCFWKGNIFQFWQPWLAKVICKKYYPTKFAHAMQQPDEKTREKALLLSVRSNWWYKVLGGCPICLNIWIGFITWPIIAHFTGISYIYVPLYLLISSFILRKIMKVN